MFANVIMLNIMIYFMHVKGNNASHFSFVISACSVVVYVAKVI